MNRAPDSPGGPFPFSIGAELQHIPPATGRAELRLGSDGREDSGSGSRCSMKSHRDGQD